MYETIGKGVCGLITVLTFIAAVGTSFIAGFLWFIFIQMLRK